VSYSTGWKSEEVSVDLFRAGANAGWFC